MRGDAFARQLKLLALLEFRPEGVGPDEVAEELGARRRTVYRDFRVLEDAGVPLIATRDGQRARWRIMPGYRHRLQLSLTWSELMGLMAGCKTLSPVAGTMLHDGATSALEKIRATLPRGLAERMRAADGLVSAAAGGRDYRSRGGILRQLAEAIDGRRTVQARYRARGRRTASLRTLDPWHLRLAEEGIYLVAHCHRSGEAKLFLLDRFDSVEVTDRTFELPAGFDAERLLQPAFGMWIGKQHKVRFVVAPELGHLFMERKAHASQVAQRRSDGSVEVRLAAAMGPPLVAFLTGWGAGVSGIQPRELREAVRREHRAALAANS